jgi:hypothetical protein
MLMLKFYPILISLFTVLMVKVVPGFSQTSNLSVEISMEFYGPYDNIYKVSIEKWNQNSWYKTITYVGHYGRDSVVRNHCVDCPKYITEDFIRNLQSIKSHTQSDEPCVRNRYETDSVGNPIILHQAEMIPGFFVNLKSKINGVQTQVRHEDPIQSLSYCPFQKERMKMLLAMKTILAVY